MLARGRRHGSLWLLVSLFAGGTLLSAPAQGGSGGWIEFENQTNVRLVAAANLGVTDPNEKDYAFGDVDQDGDLDLVCVRKEGWTTPGRRRNVLFRNEGIAEGHPVNGVLVDRTQEYATDADDGGQGFLDLTNDRDVVLVDVNGDGWLDIVTATTISDGLPKTISHPRVYINKGAPNGVWLGFRYEQARFPQLTTPSNPNVAPRFCTVTAGDIDGDGDMDLYFGDYDSAGSGGSLPEAPGDDLNDRLLINNGNGFFTDSGTTRMTSEMLLSAFSMAAMIKDMNGDGYPDVVKDSGLNFPQRVSISYNNPNNPGFFNLFDVVYNNAPYHVTVGDLNNDGRPDMVVTDDGADRYLINTGNGTNNRALFTTRTFSFQGGSDDGFGGDCYIVDLNNDGFNDVVIADVDVDIAGCNRRMHIYRNLGDVPIVTLQEQGGAAPWTPQGVHDVAIFDLDGDGWKDMVIGTCSGTQIWMNQPPIGLVFSYPQGLPGFVPPGEPFAFRVQVSGVGSGAPIPGSVKLHLSLDGGPFVEQPLPQLSPNLYEATFPPQDCTKSYRWYVSGLVEGGFVFLDPPNGSIGPYIATAALGQEITFRDEMEHDVSGWTVVNHNLQAGAWEAVQPIGTIFGTQLAAPNQDATAAAEAVKAFVTMNGLPMGNPSHSDVDGGPTYLISPRVDLAGTDGTISYAQWFFCHNAGTTEGDVLRIEVSNDDGATWTHVRNVTGTGGNWQVDSFSVGQYVTPTDQVRVRFGVSDNPNNSLTEAGIDNFQVQAFVCGAPPSIVASQPPDGAIDAGQPTNPDGSGAYGWSYVELTFDGPTGSLQPDDFTVRIEPEGTAPFIAFVQPISENRVGLQFGDFAPDLFRPGTWTTITHQASGSRVRLGYLPADVNGDGTSNPVDVLKLIDSLNGVLPLPAWSTDVDRSGVTNPADILRVIDLLNGAGGFDVWNGVSLP